MSEQKSPYYGCKKEVAQGTVVPGKHIWPSERVRWTTSDTPEVVPSLRSERHVVITTCLTCHAEMEGRWTGDSPWTLRCPACGASHKILEEKMTQ